MKNNDHGFTLVELIVSCAILGIIALGAAGFLVTGTRTYKNVNYSVRLQYESQLAMNQIQNYAIDCSKGIAYDNDKNTLYIVDEGVTTKNDDDVLYVYTLTAEHQLLFGSGTAAKTPVEANDVLAGNVTKMSVSFVPGAETGHASSASITLKLELGDKKYEGSQTTALRNEPLYADSWAKLFEALNKK